MKETKDLIAKFDLPNGDVKDVTADRTGDGHVTKAFLGHDDTGNEVGDTGAGGKNREAHDLVGDANSLPCLVSHPHHDV